jgi:hypothetical protein
MRFNEYLLSLQKVFVGSFGCFFDAFIKSFYGFLYDIDYAMQINSYAYKDFFDVLQTVSHCCITTKK